MYEYKLIPGGVIRLADMHEMKEDMSDYNWQYFVRWVKAGNIPLGIDDPMPSQDEIQTAKFYPEIDVLQEKDHHDTLLTVNKVKSKQLKASVMSKRSNILCPTCQGEGRIDVVEDDVKGGPKK